MVKKKQPDFQPTKLRVGKHLPKGRNVTNTSFKAKKIITKDQKFKTNQETSLKELINESKNNNISKKVSALKSIGNYVEKNMFTLATYFSDILKGVHLHLMDSSHEVRKEGIHLIQGCLDTLSTSQLACFIPSLTAYLDCMMTHVNLNVRKDSLDLLSSILRSHPTLICHSTKLLENLLNMVSKKNQEKKKVNSSKSRRLDDNVSDRVTSVEFRDQVFRMIVEFLEKLVGSSSQKKKPNEDEQKVYWDGKRSLYMPLYAGSGLTPAKLEVYSPSQMKSDAKISQELISFFEDFVKVSSDIIVEETASLKAAKNRTLKPENIKHLNTVTEALCYFAEWYELHSNAMDAEEELKFLSLMHTIIRTQLTKGYIYEMPETTSKKFKQETCTHLNLGIGYLYSAFITNTDLEDTKSQNKVLICVCDTLAPEVVDKKSLFLVLKILKSLMNRVPISKQKEELDDLSEILFTLCRILDVSKDHDVIKELQSFFMNIALNFDYGFLMDCKGMKSWLTLIFKEMERMKRDKKADKKILKCINQLCICKFPAFSDILNSTDHSKILDYLRFEEADFQFTAMNLLTSMVGVPLHFLQDISEFVLCDPYLSPKTAAKLIRLLNNRFLGANVSGADYREFVVFLINVGCDIVSIDKAEDEGRVLAHLAKEWMRVEECGVQQEELRRSQQLRMYEKYKPNEDVFSALSLGPVPGMYHFQLLPCFPNTEKHAPIAQVCFECLSLSPYKQEVRALVNEFLAEFSATKMFLPVHSAIALYKIANFFSHPELAKMGNCPATNFSDEILVSNLFYTSILTNRIPKEKLNNLGIAEMQKAFDWDTAKCVKVLDILLPKLYEGISSEALLHILKIVKFFYSKKWIDGDILHSVMQVLSAFENYINPYTQEQALLYQLYDIAQEVQE